MGSRWGRTGAEEGDSGVGEPEAAGDAWKHWATAVGEDSPLSVPLAGPRISICMLKVCVRGRFRGPRTD